MKTAKVVGRVNQCELEVAGSTTRGARPVLKAFNITEK